MKKDAAALGLLDRSQALAGNELAFALNCSTTDGSTDAPDLSAGAQATVLGDGFAWAGGCSHGTEYGTSGVKLKASDLQNIVQ